MVVTGIPSGRRGGEPAVDRDDRTGQERSAVRSEEAGELGDLFGLAGAAHRRTFDEVRELLDRFPPARQFGDGEARADGVGPNAVASVVDGRLLGEGDDARLRRAVD